LYHQGETAINHEVRCADRVVYFTDGWEPTLDPAMRGTSPFNWPATIVWPLFVLFVLWLFRHGAR
jgi:hypothetical protein